MIGKTNLFTILIDPSQCHNHLVSGFSLFENEIKASYVMDTVKIKHISSIEFMLLQHYFLMNIVDIFGLR